MADTTATTWTCDRCGATDKTDLGKQPESWTRVSAANPPRHAEPERYGDLCLSCSISLNRWWASVDPLTKREDAESPVSQSCGPDAGGASS